MDFYLYEKFESQNHFTMEENKKSSIIYNANGKRLNMKRENECKTRIFV